MHEVLRWLYCMGLKVDCRQAKTLVYTYYIRRAELKFIPVIYNWNETKKKEKRKHEKERIRRVCGFLRSSNAKMLNVSACITMPACNKYMRQAGGRERRKKNKRNSSTNVMPPSASTPSLGYYIDICLCFRFLWRFFSSAFTLNVRICSRYAISR